jgi:hypothetical protein
MMTIRTRLATTALGFVALLSSAARADFIPISLPDASYVSGTSLLGITAPDLTVLTTLSDGTQVAAFDIGMVALSVPTTWGSWAPPPNTESSTPRVLWTNGFTSMEIDLALPSFTFGFEAEPNTLVPSNVTVQFFSLGALVGAISLDVDGSGGARLFAASTTTSAFDMVVITGTDDFAIANLRYAAAAVVPEPGSIALVLLGLGALVLLRRQEAIRTRLPRCA